LHVYHSLSVVYLNHLHQSPLPHFLPPPRPHPDLPSFPTRRSSDLVDCCFFSQTTSRIPTSASSTTSFMRPCARRKSSSPMSRAKIGRAHGLNSSHVKTSYAVFCSKKKTTNDR